jgi:inner membrane protein
VDTSASIPGRILFPFSCWLERRFPHRTVTHSFLATAIVAVLAWPLRWLGHHGLTLHHAVVVGYWCGWFGDAFTKSGVAAFYPGTMARLVIPGNPRLRLTTGTKAEYFLFAVLLVAITVSIHLNSAGGLMRTFTALMAQPEGVASLYQKESVTHRIVAHIEGHSASSSAPIVADYEVVEVIGNDLLVRDAQGMLYLAGKSRQCLQCQILIDRVKARTGDRIVTETQELRFTDQEIRAVLHALKVPSDARVTFTGELILKDAQLLTWPASLQHYNAVQVSGSDETSTRVVRLHAATLAEMQRLADYFGAGHVLVKVVRDVR